MSSICSSGLHMAEVTDVTGDKLGLNRIKTKLVSDGDRGIDLDHAPVLTDSAGSGYGRVSVPKKGDFVIVAFLDNDMQRPVILGSVPTPTRKPPINVKKSNTVRAHKTAGGMEITIDEADNKSAITIKTKSGHKVVLEDSSSNNTLKVKSKDGKTSFTMDLKKGTINVKADKIDINAAKEANIKAGGSSIKISGKGIESKTSSGEYSINANNIKGKANAMVKFQANAQLSMQGSAGANLKSNGITQVVGPLIKLG